VLRNYRKDGTLFWNELSITPLYDGDDKLTYFIGVQKDVTERVEAQMELDRLKAEHGLS
jgi:PAS domain S-box-containing protein